MAVEKQSKKSKGGARPGAGRKKGALDKGNKLIRELIVKTLDDLGGVRYLKAAAKSHPAAFLSLLGKVMPVQVEGAGGGPLTLLTAAMTPEERSAAVQRGLAEF